jgi:hypothetical protein
MSDKDDWGAVRRRRARQPAIAEADGQRRDVFQASLAQSEELWDAAEAVGPASRPLPLFYCISQAGRAVCAAWIPQDDWSPRAHGLSRRESDDPDPARRVFDYGAVVSQRPGGAFSLLSRATADTLFSGTATVADLWASLPGFATPRDMFGERPRCLWLEPASVPQDARPVFQRVAAPTHAVLRLMDPDLEAIVNNYPTVGQIVQDGTRPSVFGGDDPVYTFPRDDGTLRSLYEVGRQPYYAQRPGAEYLVRPLVGTELVGPPSEFLTMWALLFCLSELARYYPDTWVAALDPDHSIAAVTLEQGLDLMLRRVPTLIHEALSGPINAHVRDELERLRLAAGEAAAAAGDDPVEGEQGVPEEEDAPDDA